MHVHGICRLLSALAVALYASACQGFSSDDWDARLQATYIWQGKPSFQAAYSGPNSLSADREKSYTFSTTAFLGIRPWADGEIYFNPEAVQGVALSDLKGLAGVPNGEIQKTAGPSLKLYRARLYLRQTWGLGGGTEEVEADVNQMAGTVDKRRVVLTVGNLAVIDVFDVNRYAHDPRKDFFNWSIMTHGAFDYAADARGYTWGAAAEWYYDEWTARAGRFAQSREPNGLALDSRILDHYGDQLEVERRYALAGAEGAIRLLLWRNVARMALYRDALDLAAQSGSAPDLNLVRNADHAKHGAGLSVEQAISGSVGIFARAMWADGKSEEYAFTEIDRSMSAGALAKGAAWSREGDALGVAASMNNLSGLHRDYLAAGGLGAFVGDGRLNYGAETILEAFYSAALAKWAWVTLDWQHVVNPAYNRDRGPANVGSIRFHVEY